MLRVQQGTPPPVWHECDVHVVVRAGGPRHPAARLDVRRDGR
ncbi:hypothetical protein ACIBKX_13815 [Streptomyces sp. NPDC050658]